MTTRQLISMLVRLQAAKTALSRDLDLGPSGEASKKHLLTVITEKSLQILNLLRSTV